MAEIWLARQLGLKGFERVVVIKKMSEGLTQDPSFVEMFLDEARIAAQLSHPNIVQIFELGEYEGSYFIAMEYLAGEDLAHLVRASRTAARPMPLSYTVRIIADAAAGLSSAHTRTGIDGKPLNIVHRDISPQNLIVTYEGAVKVLDFGIAKAATRSASTSSGQLKGKYSYMAPEQVLGTEVDARADVWSLGVVLFEALTRSRLFSFKDDHLATIKAVGSNEPLPTAASRNPEVPPELDLILKRALTRHPSQRFPTALAFQVALEEWLRQRPDAPMGQDIANFMRALFAERIAQRAELIELLRKGEIEVSALNSALKPVTDRSMPGMSTPALAARPGRWRWPWAVAAGGLVGVAALGSWLVISRTGSGALAIETLPPGALISIDGAARGPSPLALEELPVGEHLIVATLDGFKDERRSVRISAGGRTETQIAFPPPPAPPRPEPVAPTVVTSAPPPPVVDAGVKAPAVGHGKLTFETEPWTRVYENGKLLGETPLIQIPLVAGKHHLKLVNAEKHLNKTVEVTVVANKTTTERLKF